MPMDEEPDFYTQKGYQMRRARLGGPRGAADGARATGAEAQGRPEEARRARRPGPTTPTAGAAGRGEARPPRPGHAARRSGTTPGGPPGRR